MTCGARQAMRVLIKMLRAPSAPARTHTRTRTASFRNESVTFHCYAIAISMGLRGRVRFKCACQLHAILSVTYGTLTASCRALKVHQCVHSTTFRHGECAKKWEGSTVNGLPFITANRCSNEANLSQSIDHESARNSSTSTVAQDVVRAELQIASSTTTTGLQERIVFLFCCTV